MWSHSFKIMLNQILLLLLGSGFSLSVFAISMQSGDPSLQKWLLPDKIPQPANNKLTKDRIELGKMLFWDVRLSGNGKMSCGSCHNRAFGWSDALPKARGNNSRKLQRATPVLTNTAFNAVQMWDGRIKTLEEQVLTPIQSPLEMNMDIETLLEWLNSNSGYMKAFKKAYPGEGIDQGTLSRAIASYERTMISNNSPFDNWIKGDSKAMTRQQIRGFSLFLDENKGNCVVCHSAPNFVDDGFHNLGLKSYGEEQPDLGRYSQLPLPRMKGAFKTPTLRDISLSAPYFHDGSAATLMDVMRTYVDHGYVEGNISPEIQKIDLTEDEMKAIVAFMHALTSPQQQFVLPRFPIDSTKEN